MTKLIDKAGILSICLVIYFIHTDATYMIIPVLLVVIMSSLNSYFETKEYVISGIIAYSVTAFFLPELLFFLPLMCFDCFMEKYASVCFFIAIPFIANHQHFPDSVLIILFALAFIAYIIKYHTTHLEKLRREYINLRDDMVEFSRTLQEKNKGLMEKQDYEVNLATLNERNRIAREIHDNVGHVMSSAILQVGALLATTEDTDMKDNLSDLKETLSTGMNSIRNSVHNLHNESLDLYHQLQELVRNFTYCQISFDYDMDLVKDSKIIYAIIAIVREALSNIMKHSEATRVSLTAREHPGLYQVIISDNGVKTEFNFENGMGLNNIRTRVETLNGIFNIDTKAGFKLFVSIPKDVEK